MKPRIAFFDIETAPIQAFVWEMFEANVLHVIRPTYMLCYSLKWADKKSIKTRRLCDYPGYSEDMHCDKALVTELHADMSAADIIIGHNGDAFDIKKANARFAVHGLPPPPPRKTVDTLKISRKNFKFDSNKLDNIGRYLKVGHKTPNMSKDVWLGCMDGDHKAWAKMGRYNAQDVRLLEAVHNRISGWDNNYPDLRAYTGESGHSCPNCLSTNVHSKGSYVVQRRRYQRFQCQEVDCQRWFKGDLIK